MSDGNWVVVAACFVINMLGFGTARMSSIYYVECMHRYSASRKDALFPFVLCYMLKYVSGPLVGYSGRKIGLKETSVLGGILSAVGIGFCYLAEDILTVTILWGIVFGVGFGFSSTLLPSILNELFEEDKVKMNGYALAGGCLGGLCFPPLLELIIDKYSVSSSFLILSGIVLNSIPATMLLKNPNPKPIPKIIETISVVEIQGNQNNLYNVNTNCNTNPDDIFKHYSGKLEATVNSDFRLCDVLRSTTYDIEVNKTKTLKITSLQDCTSLPTHRKSELLSVQSLKQSNMKLENHQNQSISADVNDSNKKESIVKIFHVLIQPAFVMICLSQSLFSTAMLILWITVVDISHSKNFSSTYDKYLIGCIAAADLIGRISLGFITDSGYMKHTNYIAVCFLISAITDVCIALSNSFTFFIINLFICNVVLGGLVVVFPAVISEFIKFEHRTMAIACRCMLLGPLSFAVPPLIGYFVGTFGTYDWNLYILAITCIICIVLTLLTPIFTNKKST